MARESAQIQAVRRTLIKLLEEDATLMLEEVEREARQTLLVYRKCRTQYDIIDFVSELLKADHPLSAVDLTDTKYRPGTGYVMKRPYDWDIYIKLRVTDSITDVRVHFLSFHPERPR